MPRFHLVLSLSFPQSCFISNHRYFRQSKLTSFQRKFPQAARRQFLLFNCSLLMSVLAKPKLKLSLYSLGQLNLYGFRRLTVSEDRGGYYHELFLRGRPDLHKLITRVRVKGTGCKYKSSPATEPNFYSFPHCTEAGPSYYNSAVVTDSSEDEAKASGSGCCTKKHHTESAHSGLAAPILFGVTETRDTSTVSGQGGLQVPVTVGSAMRLEKNRRSPQDEMPPLALPCSLDARPLPAPRMLPHFQDFQITPIQRKSLESPTGASQAPPILPIPILADPVQERSIRVADKDYESGQRSQRLSEQEHSQDDPFDTRVAEMFKEPSTTSNSPTVDDLMLFFVEPMLTGE